MTIIRTRLIGPLALLACILIGCAAQSTPSSSVHWQLSPGAQASFAFLSFLELNQEGKSQEALQALDTALHLLPTPELYLEKANLLWQAKAIDEARETLKSGIQHFPQTADLSLFLAKTYEAVRRWDDATLVLQDYLRLHPQNQTFIKELGALLIQQEQYAAALDRLQTISESSRDEDTWYLMGKAASGMGMRKRAIQAFTAALDKDPEFFRAKAELGYLYEREKQYVEALKMYEELAGQGEPGAPLLLTMIRLHLKLNASERAFQLTQALPNDRDFQMDAANLFLKQQFYSYAASVLEPLAKEDDLPTRGWFLLALLAYEGQNAPHKAETYLTHIPRNDPYFERALLFRIELCYNQGKWEQAQDFANQGIQNFPRQPQFLLLKASLLRKTDKLNQALALLEKGMVTWPKHIDILFSLGVLWDEQQEKEKALEYMERIIAIDPDHHEALNYLGYSLAEQGRHLDRALVLIKNALKAEPSNGYYMDSLAWVLYKQGKLHKAWEAIDQAVKFVDKDPTIWEHYAVIAEAVGNNEQARQARARVKTCRQSQPLE